MNTTIPSSEELKRQLAEALAREQEETALVAVNEFKAALEGKYFFLRWHWRDGQAVAVARYTNFKPTKLVETSGRVMLDEETASISVATSKKTRHCFEPIGVRRYHHAQCVVNWISDVTRNHVKEISKEHFMQMWEAPRILAEAQMARWLAFVDVPAQNVTYEEPSDEAVIDVPSVALDPAEKSFVHGSPFILPGGMHLISPNAKAYVRARIREEEVSDARCAHLYEECDRHYVEMKRETITALRRKFGL